MYERYGQQIAQSLPDPPWIEEVSADGLIILTADQNFRYHKLEKQAMEKGAARVFVLSNAEVDGPTAAQWFINNRYRIFRQSLKPGPRLYVVYENGVDLRWP